MGGGDAVEPLPDLTPEESAFIDDLASALCTQAPACCAQQGYKVDPFCEANARESARDDIGRARLAGATFDAPASAHCLELLKGALSACSASGATRDALLEACAAPLVGTKAQGAPCVRDDECARPLGALALCKNGGVEASRCVDGQCALACDPPAADFVTWRTCAGDGDTDMDTYCHAPCHFPPPGSACKFMCWCCSDAGIRSCEFTAFRTGDTYKRMLCQDGYLSPSCAEARRDAEIACDGW
jgi:hypothetical protein